MECETIFLVNDADPSLIEIFTNSLTIAQRLVEAGAVREHIPFPPDTLRGILYSQYDQWLVVYHQQLKFRALTLVKRSILSQQQLERKIRELKKAPRGVPTAQPESLPEVVSTPKPKRRRPKSSKRKRERRSELMAGEKQAARAADKAKHEQFWKRLSPEEQAVWLQNRRRQKTESNRRVRAQRSSAEKVAARQAEKERQERFWASLPPEEQQDRVEKRRRQQLESLRRRRERAAQIDS